MISIPSADSSVLCSVIGSGVSLITTMGMRVLGFISRCGAGVLKWFLIGKFDYIQQFNLVKKLSQFL